MGPDSTSDLRSCVHLADPVKGSSEPRVPSVGPLFPRGLPFSRTSVLTGVPLPRVSDSWVQSLPLCPYLRVHPLPVCRTHGYTPSPCAILMGPAPSVCVRTHGPPSSPCVSLTGPPPPRVPTLTGPHQSSVVEPVLHLGPSSLPDSRRLSYKPLLSSPPSATSPKM